MAEHNTLSGASLHECKQISTAGTGDAGMVITPSDTDAGVGVLRNLTEAEISDKTYTITTHIADIGSTTPARVVVPFAGTLTDVYSVIDGAVSTTDAVITVAIDGVSTTPGTFTIAFTGSAAGDVDSLAVTNGNTVVAGDVISLTSDGAPANSVRADITLVFTKA